ncbi:MAG: matrixin family metalloprotease [Lachnospiraceae bacterium]|nr:matrixin family metalloprotease [Lachnospiraceae bacterium]
MKVKLKIIMLVSSLLLSLSVTKLCYAYATFGYKLKGSWHKEYYYVSDKSDDYGNIATKAVKSWNSAVKSEKNHSLNINLSQTSSGSDKSTRVVISPLDRGPDGYSGFTYYYNVDIFGEWKPINYGGYPNKNYQSGSAVINKYYTDSYSDEKKQNVIMHEMGHIFGLKHSTNSKSLMIENITSKSTLITPQADDVSGVRSIYE